MANKYMLEVLANDGGFRGLIIDTKTKLVERRTRIQKTKTDAFIRYLLEGGVPSEYIIQVQANLWVTGYETWDFVSYCPEYQKQPIFIHTAKRDDVLMKTFDKHIPQFLKTLEAYKNG
nr:YqaJ viral recombinase family protein [Aggregatibacter actinomycetemcomitans]